MKDRLFGHLFEAPWLVLGVGLGRRVVNRTRPMNPGESPARAGNGTVNPKQETGPVVLGDPSRGIHHALPEPLHPPEHFGIVEEGVYRSNFPFPPSFPFIKLLELKTVLLLSTDAPSKLVNTFFEENAITVHHLGLTSSSSAALDTWKPVSDELIKDALELTLDARNHPLMLCDASGLHQIGAVLGCLRRLQRWSLNSAVNEYRSFAGHKTRYQSEQFIELFDVDLITLPERLPRWFELGLDLDREEAAEMEDLLEHGKMDINYTRLDGAMESAAGETSTKDSESMPSYLQFYYSGAAPLNSQQVIREPRIQQLPSKQPS